MKAISVYEVRDDEGRKYCMGIPQHIVLEEGYLTDACIVRKDKVPDGELEEELKKIYFDSEKSEQHFPLKDIIRNLFTIVVNSTKHL